jgi:hypothetical protein
MGIQMKFWHKATDLSAKKFADHAGREVSCCASTSMYLPFAEYVVSENDLIDLAVLKAVKYHIIDATPPAGDK